jgi:Na+-transporting methylmalonyl-CoA/oxaloacetate decarboxylase gamma subunit
MSTTSEAGPRTSGMHLTRRGRALVVLLLAAVLYAAFSLGRVVSEAADQSPAQRGPAVAQTVVQSGESLWSVARRIAPEHDPREIVAQIRRMNDLQDSRLTVGQQLLLPVPA